MSSFVYLTYEQVVDINRRHCGEGAGVRDEAVIRAAVGRAEATFGGWELHPTVESKAAALLHGLSTTQGFFDGNKRTAWIVADLFLSINGSPIRDFADIEAEAFVLAVATKAFEVEGDAERGIEKTRTWLSNGKLRASDRVDYAFLASHHVNHDPTFDAVRAGSETFEVPGPGPFPISAILRVVFSVFDVGVDHEVRFAVAAGSMSQPNPIPLMGKTSFLVPAERVLPRGSATYPLHLTFSLAFDIREYASGKLRVFLDDEVAAELPIGFIQETIVGNPSEL